MFEKVNQARSERIQQSQKKRKWWVYALVFVLVMAVSITGYAYYNLSKGYDADTRDGQKDIDMKSEPFTILFIGVDQYSSKEEKSRGIRTDVLMLAAVNPKTKSIKLVSIPRDTYVSIPNTDGHKDKINSASFWAQRKDLNPMKNSKEAVQNLLGINVDYYAKINFIGFSKLVDAVGGVDVEVPFDFKIETFGNKTIKFKKGPMHLTGTEALPYVRMRYDDPQNDAGRNARQQDVVSKVVDKLTDPTNITKIPQILKIVGDNISYDIPVSDFVTLANTWKDIPRQNMETIQWDKQRGLLEDYISLNGVSRNFVYKLTEKERTRVSNLLKQQLEIPIDEPTEDSEGSSSSDEEESSSKNSSSSKSSSES
ncbi:LCP family protein [Risungbinella massiliensis]|uniref:LCP family protein n=1 Tax=Risungbinella massiliensis TaxID=1329796 RepID=UPI0005CBF570|nr:LCP family protein [Risungbinella massiliensis]